MRYCSKCGSRLDDFDSYCSNCGAKVENGDYYQNDTSFEKGQDKRVSLEDTINDLTQSASKNFEAFVCFLCGIFSLTFGTFICAIVSLVFASKAREKGQDKDQTGLTFCKVGAICSKISIALSILSAVVFIILAFTLWI